MSDLKICAGCGQEKALSEYYRREGYRNGIVARCKDCYREWHRKRYTPKNGATDDPRACSNCGVIYTPRQRKASIYCSRQCGEAHRRESGQVRDGHLRRKFGITQADYDGMLAAQGGGCAICGKRAEDQTRFTRYLHVDHSHDTGRVRGLLCDQHNLLLGRFNDDPALLRRAADYLEGSTLL